MRVEVNEIDLQKNKLGGENYERVESIDGCLF